MDNVVETDVLIGQLIQERNNNMLLQVQLQKLMEQNTQILNVIQKQNSQTLEVIEELRFYREQLYLHKCNVSSTSNSSIPKSSEFNHENNIKKGQIATKYSNDSSSSLEELVELELRRLCVPKSGRSYYFFADAICMLLNDCDMMDFKITKDIYPALATKYGITWQAVERSIRYVIGKMKCYCSSDILDAYFGKGVKLTTSAVVMIIASEVKKKFEKQQYKVKQLL